MQAFGAGQVHEGFVDRDRLDQRREVAHEDTHLRADAGVFFHVGPHDGGGRTQPPGLEHGHRGADPVGARHVAGREHHPASRPPTITGLSASEGSSRFSMVA